MKTMIEGLNTLDPKNTKKDTTTPAFPTLEAHVGFNLGKPGMTLRDYFAAKVIIGLLSASDGLEYCERYPQDSKRYASVAYILADAMMEARSS